MTLMLDSVLVIIGVVVTGVKSEKIQNIILYCWCSVITEAGGALIHLQNTFAKSLQMVEAKNTFELMHITLHVKYIITSVKIFDPFPLKVEQNIQTMGSSGYSSGKCFTRILSQYLCISYQVKYMSKQHKKNKTTSASNSILF